MPTDDRAVLRELHDRHAAAVWRFVVHLQGTDSGADDVVQETLLRAWRSPKVMAQDPATARSWMFTVARNLVIDEARSAHHRHETGTDEPPDRPVGDPPDELFDSILVSEAMASLSVEHRTVIAQAYYGGLNIAELSDVLGIPQGTVKSRLHYGLRALRLALQERGVVR